MSRPAWRWLPASALFWLAHVEMQRKQLLGIRRRAERAARAGASAASSGPGRAR